jgi:hypothetical protein
VAALALLVSGASHAASEADRPAFTDSANIREQRVLRAGDGAGTGAGSGAGRAEEIRERLELRERMGSATFRPQGVVLREARAQDGLARGAGALGSWEVQHPTPSRQAQLSLRADGTLQIQKVDRPSVQASLRWQPEGGKTVQQLRAEAYPGGVRLTPQAAAAPRNAGDAALVALDTTMEADRVEQYLRFASAPRRRHVTTYALAWGAEIVGVRVVANSVELLDGGGVPRLRVPPPIAIDSRGALVPVSLAVTGCRYDQDPVPPKGRPRVEPASSTCMLHFSVEPASVEGSWLLDPALETTATMATPRSNHQMVRLNDGRVLAFGGWDTGFAYRTASVGTANAELFDPSTRTWAATMPMSTGRTAAPFLKLPDGRIFVTGGNGGLTSEVYDPTTGRWSAAASAFESHGGTHWVRLADGRLFVAGNSDVSGVSHRVAEIYDPGMARWIRLADVPWSGLGLSYNGGELSTPGTLQIGNDVYVVSTYPSPFAVYFARYNLTSNAWTVLPAAPATWFDTLHTFGDKIYNAGYGGRLDTFDLATQSWSTQVIAINPGEAAFVRLPGALFHAGGPSSGGKTATLDLATATQKEGPTLPYLAADFPQAVALGTGHYLITGGTAEADKFPARGDSALLGCSVKDEATECPAGFCNADPRRAEAVGACEAPRADGAATPAPCTPELGRRACASKICDPARNVCGAAAPAGDDAGARSDAGAPFADGGSAGSNASAPTGDEGCSTGAGRRGPPSAAWLLACAGALARRLRRRGRHA